MKKVENLQQKCYSKKKTAKTIFDVVLISVRNIRVTSVGDTVSPLSAVLLNK